MKLEALFLDKLIKILFNNFRNQKQYIVKNIRLEIHRINIFANFIVKLL
jgi:hypothetical protein